MLDVARGSGMGDAMGVARHSPVRQHQSGRVRRRSPAVESRVKVLGHPVHPMLIVLPLGLLAMAVVFDIVYLVSGDETFANVAFWDITAGIIGGLAAAIFWFISLVALPHYTRAKKIGAWDGGGHINIPVFFACRWV